MQLSRTSNRDRELEELEGRGSERREGESGRQKERKHRRCYRPVLHRIQTGEKWRLHVTKFL